MVKKPSTIKNGSIRSFFTPVSNSAAASQTSQASRTTPATNSSPPNDVLLPSSPSSSPQVAQTQASRAVFSRDKVIKGSDEEDDNSDGSSLPDLFSRRAIAPTTITAAPPKRDYDTCVTPRAKRTALEFHSSPLTMQPRHKFDLQALLKHAQKDDATEATARDLSKFMEVLAEESAEGAEEGEDEEDAAVALKGHILETAGDGDDEGTSKMRIVRALERTEVVSTRKRYYFFNQEEVETSVLSRSHFPKAKAKGQWAILKDAKHRQLHFLDGMPHELQSCFGDLPDDIFLWLLEEVCFERSRDLREEYVKLISICPGHISRLVDSERILRIFTNIGATKDIASLRSTVTLREEISSPYLNCDWSHIKDILGLLASMSGFMKPDALTPSAQILFRLGMDGVALENFGITQDWRLAVENMVRSVPSASWDSFCDDVCTCLYESSEKATLRWQPLQHLGELHTGTKIYDLRKRLAAAFFFDDVQRAHQIPGETVSIHAIIDRLDDDELAFDNDTDYQELNALMLMLNVAVDDGSRGLVKTAKARADFDAEVDELANIVKHMLSRVAPLNRGIHVSRIDVKNAMQLIYEKLLWSVRTRERPKIRIMDIDELEEDPSLPKQRNFMRSFLKNSSTKIEA